jgi:hypothetical protein
MEDVDTWIYSSLRCITAVTNIDDYSLSLSTDVFPPSTSSPISFIRRGLRVCHLDFAICIPIRSFCPSIGDSYSLTAAPVAQRPPKQDMFSPPKCAYPLDQSLIERAHLSPSHPFTHGSTPYVFQNPWISWM